MPEDGSQGGFGGGADGHQRPPEAVASQRKDPGSSGSRALVCTSNITISCQPLPHVKRRAENFTVSLLESSLQPYEGHISRTSAVPRSQETCSDSAQLISDGVRIRTQICLIPKFVVSCNCCCGNTWGKHPWGSGRRRSWAGKVGRVLPLSRGASF